MSRRDYLLLFFLGMIVALIAASLQQVPGYMDADYYYSGALRLYSSHGFSETILWNYLDDPVKIPHPAFTYWMPMPSLLAVLGMRLVRSDSFFAARIFFILLTGLVPCLTAFLAFSLSKQRRNALLSGGLAVFPGFYVLYNSLTESVSLYMVLGSLFLVALFGQYWHSWRSLPLHYRFFLVGLLAGFLNLTRADGILWLIVGLGTALWFWLNQRRHWVKNRQRAWGLNGLGILTSLIVGYLVVMAAWYVRNVGWYGNIFPPGRSRTLWLTNYDETFSFPANILTFQRWFASGWLHHLKAWRDAFLMNLKTAIAVEGEVFLVPLILVGFWYFRRERRAQFMGLIWLVTLLIMTLVFPYAGSRGGFLHSGAAFQPFFWALSATGLESILKVGAKFRRWDVNLGMKMLGGGGVLIGLALTLLLIQQRVIGNDLTKPLWANQFRDYTLIEQALQGEGANKTDIIMTVNPAGYFVASERPSIVIPNGDEHTLLAAARQYKAGFLALEKDHVKGLDELYRNPGDRPGLQYLRSVHNIHIFRILVDQ